MGIVRIISESSEPFMDRGEAGRLLAAQIENLDGTRTAVLGIPRGCVVIAHEIARALNAQMDVVLTHKLGAPFSPELAVGAVSESGRVFVNQSIAFSVGANESYLEQEKASQLKEIDRKSQMYRSILPKLPLHEKIVIVTDDGIATGATMQAALWAIRQEGPARLILALPVGPRDSVNRLSENADETICLRVPPVFNALGRFYYNFGQVEDEELVPLLENERERRGSQ